MNEITLEASPAVALARFIAGTITDGCECDECDHRRDMVRSLVVGRADADLRALARAVDGR